MNGGELKRLRKIMEGIDAGLSQLGDLADRLQERSDDPDTDEEDSIRLAKEAKMIGDAANLKDCMVISRPLLYSQGESPEKRSRILKDDD